MISLILKGKRVEFLQLLKKVEHIFSLYLFSQYVYYTIFFPMQLLKYVHSPKEATET